MLGDLIPGWLTTEQARELWLTAARLREDSTVVEIGSHQGRSTVVLASAMPERARLFAIDPLLPDWRYGGADTEHHLHTHLVKAGVAERVVVRRARSQELRMKWSTQVGLVYVDGKHDYWSARDDLQWREFLSEGARMLVHDGYSSLGVTAALLRALLPASDVRFVKRVGSLVVFEKSRPSFGDRLRMLGPLPWFLRNLVVKVLLRARWQRLARVLGHRGEADPF